MIHVHVVSGVRLEESKHEAVEEEFFWPAVRDRVPDGDRLADHAVEQEQAAEHVLNDLIGLKADDPKFDELVRGFIADGREHIAYEETSVRPEPRKALGAEEADDLGTRLQQGKKAAPTPSHAAETGSAEDGGSGDRGSGPSPRRGDRTR
ncbi:hemerythrin domain-containing protein [Actinoallomurus sp. CA-142502]|uniref:hemerythrin domain-containing protein n=1 Tax=Actinoallomurus sp. CA-142502 TaxID=3239885 RepID=UPI003D93ACBF